VHTEGVPPTEQWSAPPTPLRLAAGEAHVWRATLAPGGAALARVWKLLSPDEQRRALRMRFPIHRARTIASRGALRILLGRYLDLAPEEIPIVVAQSGRPSLAGGARPIRFSVAHTGPLALFAFADDRGIGVDVERLRRGLPFDRLAARFFAAAEIEELGAVPEGSLPAAFFACWTRKEALFKAWGGEGGLVPSLRRFAVPVAPEAERMGVTTDDAQQWELATLHAGPGFAASLALEAPAAASCFHFDWSA